MISPELLGLLLNKYVLGSLGVIVGLIITYFKGSSAAKEAAEIERLRQEHAQSVKLRAAEAKNQFLEKKGEQQNEKINSASTIDELISLWDTQQPKPPSSPSDKDS